MEKIRKEITYTIGTILDIEEILLPYVRVAIIGKPIIDDRLVTLAVDLISESQGFGEIDYNINSISFKKISKENKPEKYLLYINIGFYIETNMATSENSIQFYGNPVNLMVLIYYLNSRGQYESKKYFI